MSVPRVLPDWFVPLARYHVGLQSRPARAPKPAPAWAVEELHRFDMWNAWRKAGGLRPKGLWSRVPEWAWQLRRDLLKTGAAVTPRSPFAGFGVFTAWDNHAAIGLPKADWAVIQLDPEGKGAETVASLKANGGYARVFGWQARPDNAGVQRAVTLGLDGYIGQAESADQYEACLALSIGMPHAMVGNVGDWWDGARVRAHGWELIVEAYDNAQPDLYKRLDSKGYPVASYCYGTYDAASERLGKDPRDATPEEIAAELARGPFRIPITEYRRRYPGGSWSCYLAETLTTEDRAVLA